MPTRGAAAWEALPPPAYGMSWSEADYHWDPVAMIATACKAPTAAAGASDETAQHPAGCSAAGRLPVESLASLTHVGGRVKKTAADGEALTALPAAGTPGTSSGGMPSGNLGGSAIGIPVAAAFAAGKAAPAHGRSRSSGRSRKGAAAAAVSGPYLCQANGCGADLYSHTYYHQRNKICAVHIKADMFLRDGKELRFCQRCGHAHPLPEFDLGKHSCRKQLEKHNARRRKRQQEHGGARQSSDDGNAAAAAMPASTTSGSARMLRRQQAAKRSRVRRGSSPASEGGAGSADVAPSANAVEALAATWDALPSSSWPSAGVQDESVTADEVAAANASPPSARLPQRSEEPPLQAHLASQREPLPAHSGPGASFGPDTSASGSAVATTLAPAAPAAAALAARPPSPLLPLLDFDFDMKPTPYEELFQQQLLHPDESALVDDLAGWLNCNLAEEEQQQQHSATATTAQLWQHAATATTAQLRQHAATATTAQQQQQQQHAATATTAQPQQQQQHAATATTAQPQQQQQHAATATTAQLQQQQQHAATATTAQPQQQQQHAATATTAQPQQQQQHAATATTAQLQQHAATATTAQLQQHAATATTAQPQQQQQHAATATTAQLQQPASLQVAHGIMQQQVLAPIDGLLPREQQTQHPLLLPYCQQQQQQMGGSAMAAGGAPSAAAMRHPPGAPPLNLASITVKLFGCIPAELPDGLREHLRGWFDGAVHGMDGYLRPGCVHLTVQALLDGHAAERPAQPNPPPADAAPEAAAIGGEVEEEQQPKSCCRQAVGVDADAGNAPTAGSDLAPVIAAGSGAAVSPEGQMSPGGLITGAAPSSPPLDGAAVASARPGAGGTGRSCCGCKQAAEDPDDPGGSTDSAVRRVVERMLQSGEALWRSKTMLVQAGSHVALVHQGQLRQTWDIDSSSARAVPAILEVSPPLLLASQLDTLRVSGINMLQNNCRLLLRLQGRYVQPAAALCSACACTVPVSPGSSTGTAVQVAADVASFEQRRCGCCTSNLLLEDLLPPAADVPAGAAAAAAQAEPAAVSASPGCCHAAAEPSAEAAAEPAGCCCCEEQESACPPANQQGACCCSSAGCPKAPSSCGRRVSAGAAPLQSVHLQLPSQLQQKQQQEPLLPGLLHLDIQCGAYVAPRGAHVLVVSSPSVHRELLQHLWRQRGTAALLHQLQQLGVVHEWVGRPEKMQYQLVEAVAARLLFWAVGSGLPATADLLLSVLQAQGGSSSAAATAVLRCDVQPGAGGGVAAALASMNGLRRLHLSMHATLAAAMQRAVELACCDGLSLLHRAVQSGCSTTLRAVLRWGDDAGSSWRCNLAGPLGITPLHLATLLPDPTVARHTVLLLMGRCAPGAQAWERCCTIDGRTPADFFRAAAAARSGGTAEAEAAALESEVAALLQLQQPKLRRQPAAPGGSPTTALPQVQVLPKLPPVAARMPAAGATVGAASAPASCQCHVNFSAPASAAAPELQPSTPRKNPASLCAPLDRCVSCSSDSDEEHEEASGHPGTRSAGGGKCCCCSSAASFQMAGCSGCTEPQGGTGTDGGGGCCGSSQVPPHVAAPAGCGGGGK